MSSIGKRTGCILMIIVLVLCMIPQSSYANETDTTGVIEVPEDKLKISGGIYSGIDETWCKGQSQNGEKLLLSVKIPNDVTEIGKNAFKGNGSYEVVSIDFSEAVNLVKIGSQAAQRCQKLTGVIDLSKTKLRTIAGKAFENCTGITGIIFPSTLQEIGSEELGYEIGSVFNGCSGIKFFRVAGGDENAVFELPKGLQKIRNKSFQSCTGLPAGTEITIPESVTYMGQEVFNNTPAITTITVETNDASEYNGGAFKSKSGYGLGKRLIVFQNYKAKESFKGNDDALTFEFTLKYDNGENAITEQKLYGQPINVCKNDDGSWSKNDNYQIPEVPDGNVRVGYDCGWEYNEKRVEKTTVLRPTGDELLLKIDYVLQNPTIEFIVDGKVIETEGTYPELSLTNNEPHTIGVSVSHPIQTVTDSDVTVEFEYEWTDVLNGSEGPRMKKPGFGRYNPQKNPNVRNTITINGPQDERTEKGNYSGEDYGDGYYLVEIYGYSVSEDGERKLFYKSAHNRIGILDYNTVDTVYKFYVTTYTPPGEEDNKPDDGSGGNSGGCSGSTRVTTDRIGGENRFETAVKVTDRLKSKLGVKKFDTIIVADSDDFADALSAAPLASEKDAPILVVNERNEKYVRDYIDSHLSSNGRVYIIGETAAVSGRFEKSLASHKVIRLGGADRYETNLKVLKELNLKGQSEIMVASGQDYPDALSASATGNPILLVKSGIFDYQKDYLETLSGDDDYFVIGGTAAVNEKIADQLEGFDEDGVSRVWGDDRFETAKTVADRFYRNARAVYIASGCDFPDSLVGGVIAYKNNAPLLLVSERNHSEAARFVDSHNVRKVTAIGGPAAVSDKVLRAVAR